MTFVPDNNDIVFHIYMYMQPSMYTVSLVLNYTLVCIKLY